MKLKKLLFSFLFLSALFVTSTSAMNINWDGGGDGVSWTDPLNWVGDVMPGPTNRAVFPSPAGAVTVVKGAGTPDPILGLWVFNNVTLALDLDLMIDGLADPVRIFTNNTLTFKSGYTFNIKGTTRAIGYYNNNSTINIEAGATVNVIATSTAPGQGIGIGTNANAVIATLNNYGTLNIDAPRHATIPNNASAWTITNHQGGIINLQNSQIKVWSTGAVSSIINNGLVTYSVPNFSPISVSGNNISTNNAFYTSGNAFFARGNGNIGPNPEPGPNPTNGLNIGIPANLVVDAASSCSVADMGIEIAHPFYSDAAGTTPVGTSTAGGAITFDPDAIIGSPGTHTIYGGYGGAVAFTVNNIDGACIAPVPPVPTLSQWGLIVLGLMMLIMVTLGVAVQQQASLATASGHTMNTKFQLSNLPFEKSFFFKAFVAVIALFTVVFAVSISAFGYEMTGADPYGTMAASGLIAYWLMLYKMEKKA